MSDASQALYTPRRTRRPPTTPQGAAPPRRRRQVRPKVVSLAEGPDRNLKNYLSYFDLSLLDGA